MNKLTNTAKTLDGIFKFLQILAWIGCIASGVVIVLLGAALLFKLDAGILGEAFNILELGPVTFTLTSEAALSLDQVLIQALLTMAIVLAQVLVLGLLFKYVRAILSPMKDGQPFHNTVSTNLKKLAWLQIIFGIVLNILTMAEAAVTAMFFDNNLSGLLAGGNVTNVHYEVEADMTFLLIAGVLFLLSYIFHYGEELQKLSDETL